MATLFSIEFLLIFWMFFIVYWLLAPWFKLQNVMLLLAGYFFCLVERNKRAAGPAILESAGLGTGLFR
ncbi:hypothetical protein PYX06_10285 [Citrobacter amalonaticus]|nr:hypothetical protein [Citrobacter amalonaticus]